MWFIYYFARRIHGNARVMWTNIRPASFVSFIYFTSCQNSKIYKQNIYHLLPPFFIIYREVIHQRHPTKSWLFGPTPCTTSSVFWRHAPPRTIHERLVHIDRKYKISCVSLLRAIRYYAQYDIYNAVLNTCLQHQRLVDLSCEYFIGLVLPVHLYSQ